jgi:hypothetical protein
MKEDRERRDGYFLIAGTDHQPSGKTIKSAGIA